MANSKIAICLFDENVTTLDPVDLIVGENLLKIEFTGDTLHEVLLFQRKSEVSKPGWVEIVQNFGKLKMDSLHSASCGAMLFIKVGIGSRLKNW